MGSAAVFTDANFETEVINASQPVLVDFWAAWCGPCRQIAPIVDQLAAENTVAKVGKLDVDANQGIAAKFGVERIPTLLLFKGGQVVERIEGAMPKSRLQAMIDRHQA